MKPALPLSARLDADLNLREADPAIEALQLAAGASLKGPLAPPQLASVARLARRLGESVSKLAHVATPTGDAQLWVRIDPDGDGFAMNIEQWRPLASASPKLASAVSQLPRQEVADRPGIIVDPRLRVTAIEGLEIGEEFVGQPLSRLFELREDVDGSFPIMEALPLHEPFDGQPVTSRADKRPAILRGEPLGDDRFEGYRLYVDHAQRTASDDGGTVDDEGGIDATLRSPLESIIRAADQIVDRSDGPIRSDYADYAGDIATAGRHLLSVIRSMSEQVTAERERVKLSVVAAEAAGLVAARAGEKDIDIEIEEDVSVEAIAERRAVLQIIVNILGNAIRHSPAGGTVAIVFEREGERATVTVADQGPGIARSDQKKIFEKFERLEAEAGTGSGLGLAISRRLARSMDGEIELDSAAGEGARFTLSLPAAS